MIVYEVNKILKDYTEIEINTLINLTKEKKIIINKK